jgi:hypothetical protein
MGYQAYIVKQGDTTASISRRFGVPWVVIWNSKSNAELRSASTGIVSVANGGPVPPPGTKIWIPDAKELAQEPPEVRGSRSQPPLAVIQKSRNQFESLWLDPGHSSVDGDFELRLVLHVFFRAMEPEGPEGKVDIAGRKDVRYVKWDYEPGSSGRLSKFDEFKRDAVKNAEKFWNGRFRLTPPASYSYCVWPAGGGGKPRGVTCTMKMVQVNEAGSASHVVRCYRRAQGENSSRVDTLTWTDVILEESTHQLRDKTGKLIPTKQLTLAHEVGHMLGLDHPVCPGEEAKCYGDGGEESQITNVLGAGNLVNKSNSSPWVGRAVRHTGVPQDQWTVDLMKDGNPLYL